MKAYYVKKTAVLKVLRIALEAKNPTILEYTYSLTKSNECEGCENHVDYPSIVEEEDIEEVLETIDKKISENQHGDSDDVNPNQFNWSIISFMSEHMNGMVETHLANINKNLVFLANDMKNRLPWIDMKWMHGATCWLAPFFYDFILIV